MASSNNDESMEYEQKIPKKSDLAKIILPEFAEKLKEKANPVYIPPPPLKDPVRR
jgi:hypothetical protein